MDTLRAQLRDAMRQLEGGGSATARLEQQVGELRGRVEELDAELRAAVEAKEEAEAKLEDAETVAANAGSVRDAELRAAMAAAKEVGWGQTNTRAGTHTR